MTNRSREDLVKIIEDLTFAYVNKDEDVPHEFEKQALKRAYEVCWLEGTSKYTDMYWKEIKRVAESTPFSNVRR